MRCVVCGGAVEDARYANAWERSRKRYPCCGDACAEAFDPDQHWIPAVFPGPADDAEAGKLLRVFRTRVAAGDVPTVVVREMLLAGVVPDRLRGPLLEGRAATTANAASARRWTIAGLIKGVLTGTATVYESNDKRDPDAIDRALADLDRWDAARAG